MLVVVVVVLVVVLSVRIIGFCSVCVLICCFVVAVAAVEFFLNGHPKLYPITIRLTEQPLETNRLINGKPLCNDDVVLSAMYVKCGFFSHLCSVF